MKSVTRPRSSRKVERSLRLVQPLDAQGCNGELVITMTTGSKVEEFRYWIDRIPSDFGTAFLVEKQGAGAEPNEEYHVLLAADGCSCECKGFLRWDHCKHVEALLKLLELGKLPAATVAHDQAQAGALAEAAA